MVESVWLIALNGDFSSAGDAGHVPPERRTAPHPPYRRAPISETPGRGRRWIRAPQRPASRTMPWLVEALVLALLALLALRTWRRGAAAVHGAAGTLLALVVSSLAAWLADLATGAATANLFARLVVPLAVVVAVFVAVRWWWARGAERCARWDAALAARPRRARTLRALVVATQAVVLVAALAAGLNVVVHRWPDADAPVRGRTLLARHLLVSPPPAPTEDPVRAAMARQRELASGLGRLFAQGRDRLADASGLDGALEAIDILREIQGLDPEAKLWLMRNQGALARLVDHPGLRAAATDPAVLDEIEHVARGSVAAAWRLGDRSDIQALFVDQEVRAAIAAVRLADLRAAWRARRAEGAPVPVAWRVDGRELPEGLETVALPAGVPARLEGALPDDRVARYRLRVAGATRARLLIDGRPCALEVAADGAVARLDVTAAGGDVALVVEAVPEGEALGLVLSRIEATPGTPTAD